MNTTLAFGIGAIFMLAGLLMLGTKTELLPRVFHAGEMGPVILGVLLVGFVLCRYGWEIWDELPGVWGSMAGGDSGAMAPQPARTPVRAAAVSPIAHPVLPQPSPHPQKTVTDAPVLTQAPVAVDAPMEVITVTAPAEPSLAEPAATSNDSADDPYDSGLKRAVKHVGRFLHIAKKPQK